MLEPSSSHCQSMSLREAVNPVTVHSILGKIFLDSSYNFHTLDGNDVIDTIKIGVNLFDINELFSSSIFLVWAPGSMWKLIASTTGNITPLTTPLGTIASSVVKLHWVGALD